MLCNQMIMILHMLQQIKRPSSSTVLHMMSKAHVITQAVAFEWLYSFGNKHLLNKTLYINTLWQMMLHNYNYISLQQCHERYTWLSHAHTNSNIVYTHICASQHTMHGESEQEEGSVVIWENTWMPMLMCWGMHGTMNNIMLFQTFPKGTLLPL